MATRSISSLSEDELESLWGTRTNKARRLPLCTGALIPGTSYRLRRWLGDGGMGAVFEAEHIDIERRVAVKLLHARSSRKEWVTHAFRNEARASGRIGSPHIVDMLDFKELGDGRLLIAMEYLEGVTLRETAKQQRLTGAHLIGIVRQICKALHAAHGAGVVHRDVKPENVMLVERSGRHDFVKVLDFGVAHILADESTNRMVGTVHFMAPEVTLGHSDARVDIYALGCLLYELISGTTVFDSLVSHDIVRRHLTETPVPPSRREPKRNASSAFDSIVMRCLEKEADARYQTMAELEAALCELQIQRNWSGGWDDLDAPDVDPRRRERIELGLRRLRYRRRNRFWYRVVLLGVLIGGLSTGVLMALVGRTDSADTQGDRIETLTSRAQAAAARFYFIYPPRDEPDGNTAYREVLELEALDNELAEDRATDLRHEFASTLVRLGDRYWDFEGARPFAHEYYASALMFVDDEHAQARLGLPLTTLERLRAKAVEGDFSEHELVISETLAALAEPEPAERVQRLTALQTKATSLTVSRAIDEVLVHERRRPRPNAKPPADLEPTHRPPSERPEEERGSGTGTIEEVSSAESTGDEPSAAGQSTRRRSQEASALAKQGAQARSNGDLAEAKTLFHRALAADRRNLAALDGLGSIAFSDADYTASVNFLERAVRTGSRSPSRWISLGDAYFKTLRYDDARQSYERARELGSTVAVGRLQKVDRKLGHGD